MKVRRMRLIDADAIEKEYQCTTEDEYMLLMQEIQNAPTIDAVPVVRCRNFKWWRVFKYRKDVGTCIHALEDFHNRGDDFFCARGERRDKDSNG